MPHMKWREIDLQPCCWLQLALPGWCLVSLLFLYGVSFSDPDPGRVHSSLRPPREYRILKTFIMRNRMTWEGRLVKSWEDEKGMIDIWKGRSEKEQNKQVRLLGYKLINLGCKRKQAISRVLVGWTQMPTSILCTWKNEWHYGLVTRIPNESEALNEPIHQ